MKGLQVEQSVGRARWCVQDVPLEGIEQIARAHDLPEIVTRLLLGRGIAPEEIPAFINPTLRDHLPDPHLLVGMEAMAKDMARAIMAGRQVAIFGDFDVNGATSSALLWRFLKACGLEARIYIPDRLEEGYGPNVKAFEVLKAEGAELVFVLDCGVTAFDVIAQGRAMGLEIVIFDHHEAEETLPVADHVINPKRKDDTSSMKMLAAVGVTFMACVAINKALRAQGFFKDSSRPEPDLKSWLDLVCLGTVCDMVPLTGVNRLLVRQGFLVMNKQQQTGLRALAQVAGLAPPFGPYHLGYGFGPRINAGGRIHKSDLGAKLLCTEDEAEAQNLAWLLNDCNDRRREIQIKMEQEALMRAEREGLAQRPAIVIADEAWHPGLAGLVATRLKDKYEKPACVVTYVKNGDGTLEARGSGRSVMGVHLGQVFIDARQAGLVLKGGGHAMAGGFTLLPDQLPAFQSFVEAHVHNQIIKAQSSVTAAVDSVLSVRGISVDMIRKLENQIGPFGQDFPEPLFALLNVKLHNVDIIKESHVRAMVSDWEGGPSIKAVAFGAVGSPMGEAFLKQGAQPFHLLCNLKINRWQGRETAEIHIKDAALVMGV